MKRREVDVISGAFPNFAKQRAVHPIHDGAIQFSGAVKSQSVFVEVGNENILYL